MPEKSITWAALASVLTCAAVVLGGIWRMDAAMDERFEKLAQDMRQGDTASQTATLQIVSQIYARRDDVASLKTKLEAIDDKLDEIRRAVDREQDRPKAR